MRQIVIANKNMSCTLQFPSILEIGTDRKLFTNHGLHLSGLGKEVLSKKIVSLTYAILDQKMNPPLFLIWNSDVSHTISLQEDTKTYQITLEDMEVPTATPSSDEGPRISKREKKPPVTKSEDFFMVNDNFITLL